MLKHFIYLHLKYEELSNDGKKPRSLITILFLLSVKISRAKLQAKCFPNLDEVN